MANAQGPEGRTVVAVPGSKGSHNEGMDLDEVVVALCFHPRLESSIFLLLLRASLGKSVGARLVGDCYINYESILGEMIMEDNVWTQGVGRETLLHKQVLVLFVGCLHQALEDGIVPFLHEAGVRCAGIEDVAKRFGLSSAPGTGGVQSLSHPPDHSLHREEVEASLGGKSVGCK